MRNEYRTLKILRNIKEDVSQPSIAEYEELQRELEIDGIKWGTN